MTMMHNALYGTCNITNCTQRCARRQRRGRHASVVAVSSIKYRGIKYNAAVDSTEWNYGGGHA